MNQPPTLDLPQSSYTTDELVPFSFTAAATDPDPGDTLTFSLHGDVPSGASIHPITGVFSWTPSEAQGPGVFTFTVRVTDDGTPNLYDEQEITITVNEVNQAPVLAPIGDQIIYIDGVLTFTASATDADLPVQLLTFSRGAGGRDD
ncbi:MAG: putative Ig domain-containing protein [Gemmataceae bacterium]